MLKYLFQKFKSGLEKTRIAFSGIVDLFRGRGKIDKTFLQQLEEKLYKADVGGFAVALIVDQVKNAYLDKEITGEVEEFVKAQLRQMLSDASQGIQFAAIGPTIVLVAGVNGSGKTTSIAKLAKKLKDEGKKVLVAACDTFRAAAVQQLTIWCERIQVDIVKNQQGSDPASVAHDACDRAKARGYDVVIVDTAGRLHTQTHLMRELEKIHRITGRQVAGAPHEVLLVLDATNGQNAINQAELFSKSVKCTGIILTKLDGSAKGGSIFAIKNKLNLPVKYIGIGEGIDDLEPFNPVDYVEALFSS